MVQGYGFVEFALPYMAQACREAWQHLADQQRPEKQRDPTTGAKQHVLAWLGHACGAELGPGAG